MPNNDFYTKIFLDPNQAHKGSKSELSKEMSKVFEQVIEAALKIESHGFRAEIVEQDGKVIVRAR